MNQTREQAADDLPSDAVVVVVLAFARYLFFPSVAKDFAHCAERELWPAYQQAYADALARCSTERAPWYVVPADRKWYRDWAVARLLQETLESLKLRYPDPDFDPDAQLARLV